MATEKRLIDANEAWEKIKELPDLQHFAEWYVHYDGVCNVLENAPTVDAVEVVHCKDCKYCDPENLHCDHPMGTTFPFLRKPDDYCSYGERRNNDE